LILLEPFSATQIGFCDAIKPHNRARFVTPFLPVEPHDHQNNVAEEPIASTIPQHAQTVKPGGVVTAVRSSRTPALQPGAPVRS
jgi:hypothetical protein